MLEIKIFLDENDRFNDKPLHEYIMRYLLHHKIIGASIFPAIMGFGHSHHLNTPKRLGNVDEVPYMILFIDEEENVNKVLPHIKEIVDDSLIVINKVERFN